MLSLLLLEVWFILLVVGDVTIIMMGNVAVAAGGTLNGYCR